MRYTVLQKVDIHERYCIQLHDIPYIVAVAIHLNPRLLSSYEPFHSIHHGYTS